MRVVDNISEIRKVVESWRRSGLKIGLVPTMGYLHEGHASLIRKASEENDRVIISIFVNPIQFGPNEDLAKYPRDLNRDIDICKEAGGSIIFHPNKDEMYNNDFSTYVDINNLNEGLCGKSRPIHFRGVCTVVSKLFNIIQADNAYFGEKDAQQLAIVKRMVRDLNFDINVVGCPIVRECDGLAKSSRNIYLSDRERSAALILNKSLNISRDMIIKGEKNTDIIIQAITKNIESEKLAKIDYVEIVDSISLKKVDKIEGSILVALAVFIGNTRLIDNFTYEI